LDKLIQNLRDAKGKWVLFLGAGASVESGGKTGEQLAFAIASGWYRRATTKEEIRRQFMEEHKGAELTFENVLESVAGGTKARRQALIKYFKEMAPSAGYRYLVTLLARGFFFPVVLTTNIDKMLEMSLKGRLDFEVLTWRDIAERPEESTRIPRGDAAILVVKLHGDIDDEASLRLTSADTRYFSSPLEETLTRLVEEKGFVVVGYRARDQDVLTAWSKAEPKGLGFHIATAGLLSRQTDKALFDILRKHRSEQNLYDRTGFDEFFRALGRPLEVLEGRREIEPDLEHAWGLLDQVRSNRTKRATLIRDLRGRVSALAESELGEVKALVSIVQQLDRRTPVLSRLSRACHQLEEAVATYRTFGNEELIHRMELRLLRERLFLFLWEYRSVVRLDMVRDICKRAERLADDMEAHSFDRAKALIVAGEAYKERAMIAADPSEALHCHERGKNHLLEAIPILDARSDVESRYWQAIAHRHIAVLYELCGDLEVDTGRRKEAYRRWQSSSHKAIKLLTRRGAHRDDRLLSYCYMNCGSSYTRLAQLEVDPSRKQELLEKAEKHVGKSLRLARAVKAPRAIAWAYVHQAEVKKARALVAEDMGIRGQLIQAMEDSASAALQELRYLGDYEASGLANQFLGESQMLQRYPSEADRVEGLGLAMEYLLDGLDKLENTSYYRAIIEVACDLSSCASSLADLLADPDEEERYRIMAISYLTSALERTARALAYSPRKLKEIRRQIEGLVRTTVSESR